MAIPELNGHGTLPPNDGEPYSTTSLELCKRYGNTPERRIILRGACSDCGRRCANSSLTAARNGYPSGRGTGKWAAGRRRRRGAKMKQD